MSDMPIRDLLKANFSKSLEKGPSETSQANKPREAERKSKSESAPISDIYAGASAQRFFNPNFKAIAPPMAPRNVKAPSETEALRGTANQMAISGAWGTPPEKEK